MVENISLMSLSLAIWGIANTAQHGVMRQFVYIYPRLHKTDDLGIDPSSSKYRVSFLAVSL